LIKGFRTTENALVGLSVPGKQETTSYHNIFSPT